MILTKICSWCKKVMREGDAPADAPVTHSCCLPCAKIHFPLMYDDIKDSLEEAEDGDRV